MIPAEKLTEIIQVARKAYWDVFNPANGDLKARMLVMPRLVDIINQLESLRDDRPTPNVE